MKSIGFPIPVPMGLVKCLFFDNTLNINVSNSKKGNSNFIIISTFYFPLSAPHLHTLTS